MKKIIFFGGGGHSLVCNEILNQSKIFCVEYVIDPKQNLIDGVKHLSKIKYLRVKKKYHAHISFGSISDIKKRDKLFKVLEKKFYFPNIISKFSIISKKSKIGDGTIVMNNVIISPNVLIGKNCIINNTAIVEHGTIIADNCHISTGVIINGNCNVGKNTFIGSGSVIVNGVRLKANTFIKAGQVIKKSNY